MTLNKKIFIPLVLTLALSSCGGGSPSPSPTPETTFTVTFNSNGGSNVPSQNIKNGGKATRPTNPIKKGNTFDNWFKDNSFSNVYDFSTPVITNLTLYAKWNINSYTVTFNSNGGSEIPSQTVNYGEKVTRPTDPKKDGYTFENWYKESSLTNVYDFSTSVITNLTLYAKWNINSYTVTFNSNGGSEIPSQTVNHGGKVTRPSDPIKNGYNFINWYQDSSLTNVYDFDTSITSNITLYAKWSDPIIYNITYNLNGGTNDPDNPITYTVEDSIIFKSASHSEATFDKWTDESGNIITHIELGTYGDITLFANWKNWKEYQVNVYTNDETKGTAQGGGTYIYGSDVTITASPLDDNVFNGWYSDSEYKILLTKNNIYKFTLSSGDVSFYAKFWTKEEDEEWNKNHGVIPAISEDGSYLTYGLYPQSHVNDTSLIAELKKIAPQADEEYFFYNGEYYVKDTGNPCEANYTFLDGTKVINDTIYYFKCEPITFNIISSNNGTYSLDCSNILNAHLYGRGSNNYKKSDIRAWLNNDFYHQAFFLNNSYIQITTVDNSAQTTDDPNNQYACENTDDKIYLRSYKDWEATTYFSIDKSVSDFAICNCVYMCIDTQYGYERNGFYWTRSPFSGESESAWALTYGQMFEDCYVDFYNCGCSPALTIII